MAGHGYLHLLEDDTSVEHCDVCEWAVVDSVVPSDTATTIAVPSPAIDIPVISSNYADYDSSSISDFTIYSLYNRPPPSIS